MACNGFYCASHCISYGCSAGYRAPRPNYSYNFPSVSDRPTAAFTNALRAAMNQELAERGSSRRVTGGTVTSQVTKVAKFDNGAEILTDLKNCINSLAGNYVTANYSGKIVQWHFTDIRDKIQQLMMDCLCNGNCGSNYWCNCYNNCDCNYSSIKLKYDVKELQDIPSEFSNIDDFNKVSINEWKYTIDPDDTKHYGPIVEDIEQYFPDVIEPDNNGYKSIKTTDLIGILWKVVQNQQKEIDILKQTINSK